MIILARRVKLPANNIPVSFFFILYFVKLFNFFGGIESEIQIPVGLDRARQKRPDQNNMSQLPGIRFNSIHIGYMIQLYNMY